MNFFKLNYWINPNPGSLESFILKVFIFGIVALFIFLLVAVIFRSRVKKGVYKRIADRVVFFAFVNFFISLYFLFVTYEGAYILAMRIWFVLWFLLASSWLFFIFKEYKKIPEIQEKRKSELEYKKYLP